VRRFKADPVPRALLDRLVAAASMAPMGIPPWEVGVVVHDTPAKVKALSDVGVDQYEGLLKMMDNGVARTLMGLMKKPSRDFFRTFLLPLGRKIVAGRREGRDALLYGAPACLLFHAGAHADAADTAIACTAAMLQAEALGLGTCMIGALPGPLARSRAASAKAGVPGGHSPKIALLVGWPAIRYRKAIRRPFASVAWRDCP
jgi:nitroreductase